jgi:membrane associated rhomboid family serine protease
MSEAGPELSVVCKSCGSEVSPYVTECPYCGTRLRKRAPRLERQGDEIRVRESRRDRRRREKREKRERRRPRIPAFDLADRPVGTIAVLAGMAVLMVVQRSANLTLLDVGAVFSSGSADPWRYLTAPFVHDTIGFIIVIGVAIAILGTAVEARLGTVATLLLIVVCGAVGMLAAARARVAFDELRLIAGGNGIALGLLGAWFALRRDEIRRSRGEAEPIDMIAVGIAAVVLLLLPVFERVADPIAGLVGGLVGIAFGALAAAIVRPERL